LDTLPHDRQREEATRIATERSRDLLWHRKPTKDARGRDTNRTNQETMEAAIRAHASAKARRAKAKAEKANAA
jgi:topoisomerase IA-like protein